MPGLKRTYSLTVGGDAKKPRTKTARRTTAKLTTAAIKRIMRSAAEQKYHQNSSGATEIAMVSNSAPYFHDLPNIPNGDGSAERVGNKIHARALEVKFTLRNNGSVVDNQWVRVALLEIDAGRWQTNTNLLTDLFEAYGTGVDVTYHGNCQDILAKFNREGIKVVRDKTYLISPEAIVGNAAYDHWYVPINKDIMYQESGSTANPSNVRYTVIFMPRGAQNDGGTTPVEMMTNAGIYFTDL